jgi:hypothetical protein
MLTSSDHDLQVLQQALRVKHATEEVVGRDDDPWRAANVALRNDVSVLLGSEPAGKALPHLSMSQQQPNRSRALQLDNAVLDRQGAGCDGAYRQAFRLQLTTRCAQQLGMRCSRWGKRTRRSITFARPFDSIHGMPARTTTLARLRSRGNA